MADVVFALTGDVRRNSRALRQIRALSEHGFAVDVLSHGSGNSSLEIPLTRVHWLDCFSRAGPSFFWENYRRMADLAASIQAKVYHSSDLYVLPALSRAARQRGGAVIYDARELYPYVASTVGRPWMRFFWQSIERQFIRNADGVITVSDGIGAKLVQLYGIDPPTIVYNVPPRPPVRSSSRLRVAIGFNSTEAIILHQGQMRNFRGCELLVDAMRDVNDAILIFLGDGPLKSRLVDQVSKQDFPKRVYFLDPVPPSELLAYTASADIGVTLLEDVCLNHHLALPNKLFEYLASNLPVVGSDLPEIRKVVVGHDVGLAVDPLDRNALVASLRQAANNRALREHWRRNIPSVFHAYNWQKASEGFLQIFRKFL